MKIAFTLSMPGRSSWNGRWSGEDQTFVIIKSFTTIKARARAQEILSRGYYSYGWSDGWRAGISCKEVDSNTARKLKRKSAGFCGYDWMVDSILTHGAIYASKDEIPAKETATA